MFPRKSKWEENRRQAVPGKTLTSPREQSAMEDHMNPMYDRLNSAFDAGTITEELLSEAVRTLEEGDCGAYSVGSSWLFNANFVRTGWRMSLNGPSETYGHYKYPRLALFVTGIDPLKFFRDHRDVRSFATSAIVHGEFLKLLPESERTPVVREIYLRHGGYLKSIVNAGLEAGISRADLASMISERFDAVPVRDDYVEDIDSFMEYGLDQNWSEREQRFILPDSAPWAVFTDDALYELLLICARKSPYRTLKETKKIQIRLGRDAMVRVCDEAARHFTKLPRWLELGHFVDVSIGSKEHLVPRVEIDYNTNKEVLAGLIVEIALSKQGERAVLDYFEGVWDLLHKLEAPQTCFRTAVRIIRAHKGNVNADVILDLLFVLLARGGYIVGTIVDEYHTGKRGRRLQHVVNHRGMKYVHDDFNHRWFPKEGDRVIVNTRSKQFLTPTVVLDCFIPLDKDINR